MGRTLLAAIVVVITCLADWASAITRLAPQSGENTDVDNSSRIEGVSRLANFLSSLKAAGDAAQLAKSDSSVLNASATGSQALAALAAWGKQQAEKAANNGTNSAVEKTGHGNGTKHNWASFASWVGRQVAKAHNSTEDPAAASHNVSGSNVRKPDWAGFASWATEQVVKANAATVDSGKQIRKWAKQQAPAAAVDSEAPAAAVDSGRQFWRWAEQKVKEHDASQAGADVTADKALVAREAAVQEAAGSVAVASSQAAASAAKDSLGTFLSWLNKQGDIAARNAVAKVGVDLQSPSRPQKTEENITDFARKAWQNLMDKAKAAALQTVKGEAAEHAKQSVEAFNNLTDRGEANASTDPDLFEAWSSADKAWRTVSAADKAEKSAADIAASAAWIVDAGHNISKALSRLRRPGATSTALKALTAAGERARESLYDSYVASNGASDVKELFTKAVWAALRTNWPHTESAAVAVARTYTAVEKAGQDALMAARHANDATLAVARALAEVGWRAVSEILASELTLAKTVAGKISAAKDMEKFAALAEGLTQAKKVAQIAWFKGMGDGLRRPASAEALSKFARASNSVANVSHAWISAVSSAMQTKQAQEAVAKAASAAATAASVAAAKASGEQAKKIRETFQTAAEAGRKPWMKPGSSATTFSHWTKEAGLSSDSVNKYDGMSTKGHFNVVPNSTHLKIDARGSIVTPITGSVDGSFTGSIARSRSGSSDGKASVKTVLPFVGPAESTGEFTVDPVPHAESVRSLKAISTFESKDRHLKTVMQGAGAEDGRGFVKAHLTGQIPELTDNLDVAFDMWEPFPAKK